MTKSMKTVRAEDTSTIEGFIDKLNDLGVCDINILRFDNSDNIGWPIMEATIPSLGIMIVNDQFDDERMEFEPNDSGYGPNRGYFWRRRH